MATENLTPQVISRLLSEIRDLIKNPPEGITYIDSEDENNTVSEIHAVITGPEETPYFGGRFRLKLVLGEDYPNAPPKGFFITKIYHPNIAATGDICVNTLKKDWNTDVTIKHVLQVVRCLLIVPFPESSLNDEAGKLFMDSYEEFARRARIMTEVHAISSDEENLSLTKLGQSHGTETTGESADAQEASSASATAAAVVSEESMLLQKKKDAKKKILKRL